MYTMIKVFAVAFLAFQLSFSSNSSAGEPKSTTTIAEGGDNIRTKTDALVLEKLVIPYKSKVKDKDLERRKFSRCPSGYRHYANEIASTEAEYSYGEFKNYVGCSPQEICKYRARLNDNTVEILQADEVNYIPVDLWLNSVTASAK